MIRASCRRAVRVAAYCALLLWVYPVPGHASGVEALQAADRLRIGSSLSPRQGLVPGQKAVLTLEVATDRWFTGGTRIGIPEVPGLVILQTEQFASNSSENRDGQSWVVQRWNLDVYPQRSGDFTVPPIALQVQVNTGAEGAVEGEIHAPRISFSVAIPPGLAQAEHWVAAPDFTASQSFDRAVDDLQVGDALQREIVFEASDLMAMMLPTFEAEQIAGLGVYPSPPVLDNSSNRGVSRARRSRQVSYVVEAEGRYLLPARDYFWWDTRAAQLKLLSLPAVELTVGTGSSGGTGPQTATPDIPVRLLLGLGGGLLLLLVTVWLARNRLSRLPLARARGLLLQLRQLPARIRKPALPQQLNPGNSAGE